MRKHAVDFYFNLYAAVNCDNDCMMQLFEGLPQFDGDSKIALDADIMFKEFTAAVGNLNIVSDPTDCGHTHTHPSFNHHHLSLIPTSSSSP